MKCAAIWCLVSLIPVATLAAATDVRLVEATQQGDREAVRSLLQQHIDVNAPQPDGTTALAWAAHRDDLQTAGLLIGAGANVNAANDYGVTPLWLACSDGSEAMVDKLLKAGANPDAAIWMGETPLMECSRTGKLESVKSLVASDTEINAKENRQGHTALMWAAAAKHADIVGVLIEHGAEVNGRSKGGFTPLMFAVQQGDMDAARMLLAAGADVNGATPDGDTPLLLASAGGHEELAIFLLDKGANANAADLNGITALDYTMLRALGQIGGINVGYAYNPHMRRPDLMELAKALLAHRANPNAPLISPARDNDTGPGYGKIQRIDHTNNGGGRISPVGATPVLLAALSRNPSMMRMLVAAGGDLRLTTSENVTPVMAAAGMGWGRRRISQEDQDNALEVIKIAVQMGSDVNAAEEGTGLTALHSAAFIGGDKIIQYLVENGAQLDAKDVSGQTPLHKASNIAPKGATLRNLFPTSGYLKSTVDLLLKLGATPAEQGDQNPK